MRTANVCLAGGVWTARMCSAHVRHAHVGKVQAAGLRSWAVRPCAVQPPTVRKCASRSRGMVHPCAVRSPAVRRRGNRSCGMGRHGEQTCVRAKKKSSSVHTFAPRVQSCGVRRCGWHTGGVGPCGPQPCGVHRCGWRPWGMERCGPHPCGVRKHGHQAVRPTHVRETPDVCSAQLRSALPHVWTGKPHVWPARAHMGTPWPAVHTTTPNRVHTWARTGSA